VLKIFGGLHDKVIDAHVKGLCSVRYLSLSCQVMSVAVFMLSGIVRICIYTVRGLPVSVHCKGLSVYVCTLSIGCQYLSIHCEGTICIFFFFSFLNCMVKTGRRSPAGFLVRCNAQTSSLFVVEYLGANGSPDHSTSVLCE